MKKSFQAMVSVSFNLFFFVLFGGISVIAWNTSAQAAKPESQKGSAQLWSENCARCHNMRSPSTYSDKQWEIIVHHMRVRGNLTSEEHKKIIEFLKSGS